MKKTLLILDSSDIGARYTAEAALRLGFSPLFFFRKPDYQADTLAQIESYDNVALDTRYLDAILRHVHDSGIKVDAVVTLVDSRLPLACQIAKQLQCLGPDPVLPVLKDKAKVAELVPENSPKTVLFSRKDAFLPQLVPFLKTCQNGIIVKPRFTAGALGFFQIKNVPDLMQIGESIQNVVISEQLSPDLWMAQEFLPGEVVSYEGFACQGQVTGLGVTSSTKVGYTQSRSFFPHDDALSPAAKRTLHSTVQRLIEKSGFKNGYFHCEFLVRGNQAVLIDANMGRIGGGGIAEHIAISSSLDPVEIFLHFLSVTLFHEVPFRLDHSLMRNRTKSYAYGVLQGGILQEVKLPRNEFGCFHTRILDDDSLVPSMGENNWAWVGILTGPDEAIEKAFQDISIRLDGKWVKPVC